MVDAAQSRTTASIEMGKIIRWIVNSDDVMPSLLLVRFSHFLLRRRVVRHINRMKEGT